MSESRDILREEFQDSEYRHAYAEDFLNTKIATQIRVLREQRGWTQADLADKIGTKQAGVSRLENVNYSRWKIETLKRIARAFDVTFNARFESFGKLLEEAEEFSRQSLEKPSFDGDPVFHQSKSWAEQTTVKQTVPEEIPGNLIKKAVGADRPTSHQSFERSNEILRHIEHGNFIPFPVERRWQVQHEEPQYEALSSISR